MLLKSRASHALVLNELILAIMDDVLGPHCDWYQLNLSQGIRIHPGERQQVPHRDEEMWPCAKGRAEYLVNVMWALSDYTAENGATLLWPRSQFASLSRDMNEAGCGDRRDATRLGVGVSRIGDACGGANRSSAPRTGLILSYSLGWLKQYENAFLTYPPQVAREFSQADSRPARLSHSSAESRRLRRPGSRSAVRDGFAHARRRSMRSRRRVALELQAHYQNRAGGEGGVALRSNRDRWRSASRRVSFPG